MRAPPVLPADATRHALSTDLQEYLCRRCGATYTSLDAIRLLDPATGGFRCEECRSELDANVDASGLGGCSCCCCCCFCRGTKCWQTGRVWPRPAERCP